MLTIYIISLTCCLNFDSKNFKILFYSLPELETNKKLGREANGIVQVIFHSTFPLNFNCMHDYIIFITYCLNFDWIKE